MGLLKGERSWPVLRHAPFKAGFPPVISAAWLCNPRRSLGAQVSLVCPQISSVIRGTPAPQLYSSFHVCEAVDWNVSTANGDFK